MQIQSISKNFCVACAVVVLVQAIVVAGAALPHPMYHARCQAAWPTIAVCALALAPQELLIEHAIRATIGS